MTVCIRGKVTLSMPAAKGLIREMPVNLSFEKPTKCVVDANSPSHALFSLDGGKYLGGVLKRDWALS